MWCRHPEVLDLCVTRVLHGESVGRLSREAGVSRRVLQEHVIRAQERRVEMAMDARQGCAREDSSRRHGQEDALHTEETRRVRLRQSQEQQRRQQRESLPAQDEYIYEVHRAPSSLRSDHKEMEVGPALSAPEEEGMTGGYAATGEEGETRALEWAIEEERHSRKRRKMTW